LGNLDDAITRAATMAGLKDYRLVNYPETPSPLVRFIDEITGKDKDKSMVKSAVDNELKALVPEYVEAKAILNNNRIQTRLPFVLRTEM